MSKKWNWGFGYLSRGAQKVKNVMDLSELDKKSKEIDIKEAEDKIWKILSEFNSDKDKSEVYNRVRSRFHVYLEITRVQVIEHLKELNTERQRFSDPVIITSENEKEVKGKLGRNLDDSITESEKYLKIPAHIS